MANKIKCFDVNPFLQTLMKSRQLHCSSRAVKCQLLSCSSCPVLYSWSLGDDNQSNNIDSITSLQFPFRFPGHESPSEVDVILPLVVLRTHSRLYDFGDNYFMTHLIPSSPSMTSSLLKLTSVHVVVLRRY